MKNLINEYKKFLSMASIDIKSEDAAILNKISSDLFKNKIYSILQLLLVHIFSGTLILSICPQFEFRIFNFNGILNIFMLFGHNACMFFCGSLFISSTIIFSYIFLPKKYLRYLNSINYFKIFVLIFISLLFFFIVTDLNFDFHLLLWILGAIISSCLVNFFLKYRFLFSNN